MGDHRFVLYGTALVVAGALGWAGFIRKVDADPGTLINASRMRLEQASMHSLQGQGPLNRVCRELLEKADADLELAERLVRRDPGANVLPGGDLEDVLAMIWEYRAWGRYLGRDREEAIAFYGRIVESDGIEPGRRSRVYLSMAGIYMEMGRSESALKALDRLAGGAGRLAGKDRARAALLRARALRRLGAPLAEVAASLDRAGRAGGENHTLQCDRAELYAEMGMRAEACRAYERAAVNHPRAFLPLARLKFRAGDVEGALSALERLAEIEPEWLRARLGREKGLGNLAEDPALQAKLDGKREK